MTNCATPTRVLIVSGQHFADAPRRVDLHFMAECLLRRGASVDFLVWRLSPISRFLKDGRYAFARKHMVNRWHQLASGINQYIWLAPIHPINLKLPILNKLADPIFARFGHLLPSAVRCRLKEYSHIVIESGPSPLLVPIIRHHAPSARIIYHAADRLSTIGVLPAVERIMTATIAHYDLIHILSEGMRADFPAEAPVLCLPHGIDRAAFETAGPSPYRSPRNAVSVGDMLFDAEVIDILATTFPDWTFHLFGKKAQPYNKRSNIVAHGEQPFQAIAPYIVHANIGIAPYRAGANADYLSQSSLKLIQYSYCRLPIITPLFASAGRIHALGYQPGDAQSIKAAFEAATKFDRSQITTSDILDWSETTDVLFAAMDTGATRLS